MITLRDLANFCELSEEEIEIISRYAHEPIVLSLARAKNLMDSPEDLDTIKVYFEEEMRQAQSRGDVKRAKELKLIYQAFERSPR